MNGEEATNLAAGFEPSDHLGQRRIGQPVAVVRQENLFIFHKPLNGKKTLSDISPNSGIDKRNPPIGRSFANNLNFGTEVRNYAVTALRNFVVHEIVLNNIGLVAKAKNELIVFILTVILHDMPQNRMMADWHHRLWYVFGVIANARTQTAAK